MILEELVKYDEQHVNNSDLHETRAGFGCKAARYIIRFTEEGFDGCLPLGNDKKGEQFPVTPDLKPGTVKSLKGTHFLCDRISRIVPLAAEAKADPGRAEFFCSLLRESPLVGGNAMADCLENDRDKIRAALTALKAKPGDSVTVSWEGKKVLNERTWHDWWARKYLELEGIDAGGTPMAVDMVTGEMCVPEERFAAFSGMGQKMPLVSFDKDAFNSYGLVNSQNASMSAATVSAINRGLQMLLGNRATKFRVPDNRSVILHWTDALKMPSPLEVVDSPNGNDYEKDLDAMGDPKEEEGYRVQQIKKLLGSVMTPEGKPVKLDSEYFMLTISNDSPARITIRNYKITSLRKSYGNICKWFEDFQFGQYDKYYGLYKIMGAVLPHAEKKILWETCPKQYVLDILTCAIDNMPLPEWFASLAMQQIKSLLWEEDRNGKDRIYPRIQLGALRAYLLRSGHRLDRKLDRDNPTPSYHVGRLLRILEDVQNDYHSGQLNADVTSKYLGSLLSSPGRVIPSLVAQAMPHLERLRKSDEDNYLKALRRLGEVLPKCEVHGGMDAAAQYFLILGYYHQGDETMSPMPKDQENESPAFHAGRLFRIYSELQRDYYAARNNGGEIGSGLVSKLFRTAMTKGSVDFKPQQYLKALSESVQAKYSRLIQEEASHATSGSLDIAEQYLFCVGFLSVK